MQPSYTAMADQLPMAHAQAGGYADVPVPPAAASAVSWGAIAAGAAAAASLSLILLILGVGLGLSSVSPWAADGIGAATFGVGTIVWLGLTQVLASGAGGYLAGRLRSRWSGVPADEVFFRDSAHGFLAWAVASLATAALLGSAIGSIVGGGLQAGASVAGGAVSAVAAGVATASANDGPGGPMTYAVETLFRKDAVGAAPAADGTAAPAGLPADPASLAQDMAEVGRIFMNAGRSEMLAGDDLRHAGQIVAQRTGLSQADAERRITELQARAQATMRAAENATREAADKARQASAYGALWIFVSLLIGAFVASLAATFGGRQRNA